MGAPGARRQDRVLCLRRPADAGLARQPRRPRAAPVAVAVRADRAPDRDGVRPRSGPGAGSPSAARSRCPARRARPLGLDSFAKTSGSKGIQVYVPLNVGRTWTTTGTKRLSQALARHLEAPAPEADRLAAAQGAAQGQGADRLVPERRAQDDRVRLLAARAERPTVSTPLAWEELDDPGSLVFERPTCSSAWRSTATCSRRWSSSSRSFPTCKAARERTRAWCREMVDWSLARQVARPRGGAERGRQDRASTCAPAATRWSRTWPATPPSASRPTPPPPEVIGRADWATANLDSMSRILDPVAARLDDRLAFAGPWRVRCAPAPRRRSRRRGGPGDGLHVAAGAGPVRRVAARRRGPAAAPVRGAQPRQGDRELDVDPEAFGRWICAHELTHVFQFQGVPWLREHLGGLLEPTSPRWTCGSSAARPAACPRCPIRAQLVERFRDGGLAALVQTREQRDLMDEIQAAMAVIEGYSEHVMDAIGAEAIPGPRGAARGDGPAPREPLRSRATAREAARLRPEAAPVRAGQEVLRRGGGATAAWSA